MKSLDEKLCHVALVVLSGLPIACSQVPQEETAASTSEIIDGAAPAHGGLKDWGVVSLNNGHCSGVLLTNRHVLTAQHCIRNIDASPFSSTLPVHVKLEKALPELDEEVVASTAFEHAAPYSYEFRDYAILVLDAPISVNGGANAFYRPHWRGTDLALKSQTVFCAGYGYTTLAKQVGGVWVPGGNGKLTSANQIIDDVWGGEVDGTLIRRVHGGIVGAAGDSGSPCFFLDGGQWFVTGPQSNCPDYDYTDLDGSHDFSWPEATAIRECRGAAPSAYHHLIADNLFASVTLVYDALPAVPPGFPAIGSITTTEKSIFMANAFAGNAFAAPRSGSIQVAVTSEPPNTMCPVTTLDAPMNGSLAISGRCLGDGLLASLVTNPL